MCHATLMLHWHTVALALTCAWHNLPLIYFVCPSEPLRPSVSAADKAKRDGFELWPDLHITLNPLKLKDYFEFNVRVESKSESQGKMAIDPSTEWVKRICAPQRRNICQLTCLTA